MYRMKCSQTEIAFCLFVIKKTKQWGVWVVLHRPISLTNKYKLYILCMLHSARHGQYQGKLLLNNIPLIRSCTSLCYTHAHTLAHPREAWHTSAHRPENKLQLGYNNGPSELMKRKEEIKRNVYGNTRHCPWSGGRSGFLVKAHWSWLSSTWHLAWLKQPILQKATKLENL